jgi:hypothetical protein
MNVQVEWITGISLGFEWFDDAIFGKGMMLDLLILRVVISQDD